jgi:hypothetical protein
MIRERIGQLRHARPALLLPREIANLVEDRRAEIGLERPLMPHLEGLEAVEGGHYRVLDEIGGLLRTAKRGRQTAVRPSAQRGKAPVEQALERSGIPLPGTIEQFNRCLWRQRFSGHLRCWQGVDGEHHTLENNASRPQIQQVAVVTDEVGPSPVDHFRDPPHTPAEDAVRTPLVIACLLIAAPAVAQTRVYTNADLGKPLTWARSPTPEELASLRARQFVPPPQIPERPSLRVIDGDPTHGPFGPFEMAAFTEPLDPNWYGGGWGYWNPGFSSWFSADKRFRGGALLDRGGRLYAGTRPAGARGMRPYERQPTSVPQPPAPGASGSKPGRGNAGAVSRPPRR